MDGRAMPAEAVWLDPGAADPAAFEALVTREATEADHPRAAAIFGGRVPVYEAAAIPAGGGERRALLAEWARALLSGPGVIAIRGAWDRATLDRASATFDRLIAREKAAGAGGGDHFAAPGANDRLWNAAQKHALADPEGFALYYASDALAAASTAWLGPGYQVTAQVNRVNPGGAAQVPHRDYHLGFMSPAEAALWPAHAHALSPALTLQGAVAHVDVPVEGGPTMLLPFSQGLPDGYLTLHDPRMRAVFDRHHLQMPMRAGDAVFFNPALMHGAGTNRTADLRRLVNLFQVSSAFGRAIETVDRAAMAVAVYPALLALRGRLGPRGVEAAAAACAEGYAFPTNLDRNPPVGGMAPAAPRAVMVEMLRDGAPAAAFAERMREIGSRDRA